MKKITLIIAALLFSATFSSARTIIVTSGADSGTGTLRQAVLDANDGDTIVFAQDVTTIYFAGVIIIDKNITISGNETNNIVFQNASVWTDNVNRRRYFEVLENVELTLNYLTLKDHVGNCSGGAIHSFGILTLNNCIFSNNSAFDFGGAVRSVGILNVDNCIFINNYAPQGGGAINAHGEITITNSRFIENSVPRVSSGSMHAGGAIRISNNAIAYITNCIFEGNIASLGGAISNWGRATIDNSIFRNNKATMSGAVANSSQITISNTVFYQNEADNSGIFGSRPYYVNTDVQSDAIAILTNCLFSNNISTSIISQNYGTNNRSHLTMINCTVADNTSIRGIEIFSHLSAVIPNVELYNTILWNNGEYDVYNNNGVFTAHNSLIGTGNIDLNVLGENNLIGIDPLFVGNGDYSLQAESPAIDAGDNNLTGLTDLAGNPRIVNGRVDMGAFEFQQNTVSNLDTWNAVSTALPVAFYTITGIKLQNEPERGLYIILYDDGTTEKRIK